MMRRGKKNSTQSIGSKIHVTTETKYGREVAGYRVRAGGRRRTHTFFGKDGMVVGELITWMFRWKRISRRGNSICEDPEAGSDLHAHRKARGRIFGEEAMEMVTM